MEFKNAPIHFLSTALRIGQSEAKFDAEADFNVRSAAAPQKPDQIDEKPFSRSKKFPPKKNSRKILFGAKKSNVANRLKRVLTNFDSSPGLVRGVNGRSKFDVIVRRTSKNTFHKP